MRMAMRIGRANKQGNTAMPADVSRLAPFHCQGARLCGGCQCNTFGHRSFISIRTVEGFKQRQLNSIGISPLLSDASYPPLSLVQGGGGGVGRAPMSELGTPTSELGTPKIERGH
ncbi:hypothetical protein ACQY0O_001475 [Thecaphora frezii]